MSAQLTATVEACPECGLTHLPDCPTERKAERVMCYFAALELVERVDYYLDKNYHFRDKGKVELHHLDQVVVAIEQDRFPPLPEWCGPVEGA